MKTYKQTFEELNRPALMPFFVIGDPNLETSFEIVKTAIDSGVDMIELGIPFSDPIADGPTIQKADIRALANGMTVKKALEFIRRVKEYKDIPIGLLMYYNLLYQYGTEKFFEDFHAAGVNSVLVADLSIDDADEIAAPADKTGTETVFMVTPNTTEERMKLIASRTNGFVYTVSLLGITGARKDLSGVVENLLKQLKQLTDVPLCVGFGISTPDHAVKVAKAGADGVIIGSRLVKIIEQNLNNKQKMQKEIANLLTETITALEKVGK